MGVSHGWGGGCPEGFLGGRLRSSVAGFGKEQPVQRPRIEDSLVQKGGQEEEVAAAGVGWGGVGGGWELGQSEVRGGQRGRQG